MRITVLVGGTSVERDVSFASGAAIVRALEARGHHVVAVDTGVGRVLESDESAGLLATSVGTEPPDLEGIVSDLSGPPSEVRSLPLLDATDAIFVALHGGTGEDGHLQALLDLIGIPYTGSGHIGSVLAMDKLLSKQLFVDAGIPTPPWMVGHVSAMEVERELGFPVIVKPSREGSTVGVSLVREPEGLEAAFEAAAGFHGAVLVERYIPGRELAIGVLGDEALPVVEIVPSHEIYDYECKYTAGRSQYRVPAPLDGESTSRVRSLALAAHRTLRLESYSRVDFRLDPDGRPWCLEANSLPGMTETSLLPKAAKAAGVPFDRLCERIIESAIERTVVRGNTPEPSVFNQR